MFHDHAGVTPDHAASLLAAATQAARTIPPAFPLTATVAVNPFLGQSDDDLATASAEADVIMVLLPDTEHEAVYEEFVKPNLSAGDTLLVAHGFSVRFGYVAPPADVDVAVADRLLELRQLLDVEHLSDHDGGDVVADPLDLLDLETGQPAGSEVGQRRLVERGPLVAAPRVRDDGDAAGGGHEVDGVRQRGGVPVGVRRPSGRSRSRRPQRAAARRGRCG